MTRPAPWALAILGLAACSNGSPRGSPHDGGTVDGRSPDASPSDAASEGLSPPDGDAMPPAGDFCALPGSVVFSTEILPDGGKVVVAHQVPGGRGGAPSLAWMHLPPGYCAHYFASVPTTRQLRFAPDGHLFAASPVTGTTGGANNGTSAIVALPDDDKDGYADRNATYLSQLPSTQGLLFTGGYLYYQDGVTIRRVPFQSGDLSPSGASEVVTTIKVQQAPEHWPKVLDVAKDGTIYVTNGSTQGEACLSTRPVFGAIFKVNGDGSTTEVTKGFRNPIALRCEADHDTCLAVELALDYSGDEGGREKVVPVRQGDDWGFPCCGTQNLPYSSVKGYADNGQPPDCSGVAPESASFVIGHTPFGIAFEPGKWPAPWTGRAFVTLHGVFGSWVGARVVALALDGNGVPLPSTDLDGGQEANSNMLDFALGWDDGTLGHGRPAAVEFAPDGRMFLGDDQLGVVLWIAPVGLTP